MGESLPFDANHTATSTTAAMEAFDRGYQAIPIAPGSKRPHVPAWTQTRWKTREGVRASFDAWHTEGATNLGLLLGEPSGGLVDVDLDHPLALRLSRNLLPPTAMKTGRAGHASSHYWYLIEGDELPPFRAYKMPDGSTSVELRSDAGHQTLIPPSIHPSGEPYRWEGEEWGGTDGPAVIHPRVLSAQVALLAMVAVLLENWPRKGGRHDAYLALAGGLLRFGDNEVHPRWEKSLPVVISTIADLTHDEEGARARVSEVMATTTAKLRDPDGKVFGWPKLSEIIGADHAEMARRLSLEAVAFTDPDLQQDYQAKSAKSADKELTWTGDALVSSLPDEKKSPMELRKSSWEAVNLEPYLTNQIVMPEPSILRRSDGQGLMYPGRVNSLFGKSESAKSWLALHACAQEMVLSSRVLYLDFEDSPEGTVSRLRLLGVGADDLRKQFHYAHPETPLSSMERSKYGGGPSKLGLANQEVFDQLVAKFDPSLIVADGMTALYSLHGLDTNDASSTAVISTWLQTLCRNGRTTVIVIDHTGKNDTGGNSPIGAHHKIAMIQGTALRMEVVDRPMPGAIGKMHLIVAKDRPGSVRKISSRPKGASDEQVAGTVVLDSTDESASKLTIEPPDPDDMDNTTPAIVKRLATMEGELQDRILAEIDKSAPGVWLPKTDLCNLLGMTSAKQREKVAVAYKGLIKNGNLEAEGESRWIKLRRPQLPS